MRRPDLETSAGGIVTKTSSRKRKILMVKVRNLQREIVWTFPKGHIERGENAKETALREVKEETGWDCKIPSNARRFVKVKYFFKRGIHPIRKEVYWYLMHPIKRTGKKDPQEILAVRWFTISEAEAKVAYSSDKKILSKLHKEECRDKNL